MAKNVITPDDVDIASMRKEVTRIGNLLAPGPGTPWEDRSAIGGVAAFFKTLTMSLLKPGTLLHSLRRPETAGDARVFAILCGLFWGIGWVVFDVLTFPYTNKAGWQGFEAFDAEKWALHFALGVVGTWVLLNLISRVAYKLLSSGEMRAKFPPVLAFNVYAYCLGPSILAMASYKLIGPVAALVWIFLLSVYACVSRLAIRATGAIVCNAIAFAGVTGVAVAAYLLVYKIIDWLY
jgi:hypothetical protein